MNSRVIYWRSIHTTLLISTRGLLCTILPVALLLLATTLATKVHAQFEVVQQEPKAVDPAASLDANARLIWNTEWSIYASRYTKIDDEYYACAMYEPGFPSSSHVTAHTMVQRNSQTRTIRLSNNLTRDIKISPSLSDAQAAVPALPSLDFGAYGHVHSVEVVKILGPSEMIVRQIWLIDADKLDDQIQKLKDKARDRSSDNRSTVEAEIENNFMFRQQLVDHQSKQRDFRSQGVLLLGYDTKRVKEDERWNGPEGEGIDIAIAGPKTIAYSRSSSSRPRDLELVVALPVKNFKGRLTRDDFLKMLATRNLTLQQFIDMSTEEKKSDSDLAVYNTIKRVEENRPKAAAAQSESDNTSDDKVTDKIDDKDSDNVSSDEKPTRRSRANRRSKRNSTDTEKAEDAQDISSKQSDDDK